MRFVMFMIPEVYQPKNGGKPQVEEGFAPKPEEFAAMGAFNERLAKAGALIDLSGLQPLSKGARVDYKGGTASVTDGPFAEVKEVVGGYWIIDVESKEKAIEWARQIPAGPGDIVEIRPIFELSDFPEEVQQAADFPTVKAVLEAAH